MLDHHALFAGVPPHRLEAYRSSFIERRYRRSEVVFHQGGASSATLLVTRGGIVENRVAANGNEIALHLLGPGSIAGVDALVSAGAFRPSRVVALNAVTGFLVSSDDLLRIVAADGTVATNLVRILCLRNEQVATSLEELATLKVGERITNFLGRIGGAHATGDSSGVILTQEHIARFIASRRETVCSEMRNLARSGRVVRIGRRYAVPPRERLKMRRIATA